MPYAHKKIGVYRIANPQSGKCYVGQSTNVPKRVADHFNLLRSNKHPNKHLQYAFNKHGEQSFEAHVEVECEDPADLDAIEEAFLQGDAWFEQPAEYNIAQFVRTPRRGVAHSEETRAKISATKQANPFDSANPEYRAKLREGQRRHYFSDPAFVAKIKTIVDNPHLTYVERARMVGTDTSTARKLALKYADLKGKLP